MLRNRIYYRLKPFLPQAMRLAVRRQVAKRLRDRVADEWPILPGSETAPLGWPGWPDGKEFAFVLTHDVEGPSGVAKTRELMHLVQSHGLRSSFNFIPEGSYRVDPGLRAELADEGFEVGLHDLRHDGFLYKSRGQFRLNASRINGYLRDWQATGFRSGFMLNELDWLHDLDIRYDLSTFDTDPFEPQPTGRRTIFPFQVRPTSPTSGPGYTELPYTLPQDSTLFLLLGETTPDVWKRKLAWVASHGGLALVNIHPDYIDFRGSGNGTTYPASIIDEFLAHLTQVYHGRFWNPLPRELAAWYQSSVLPPSTTALSPAS